MSILKRVKYSNSDSYYVHNIQPIKDLAFEVMGEVQSACGNWPEFNSAHEGYAVLLEEVDELWEHVKTNQKRRDIDAMRKEAIQIAAMAMRFALDICNEVDGRK